MNIQVPIFAIVTPFDRSYNIDFAAFEEYLGFLHRFGVQTLIVNGTTGEFASMTSSERKRVLEFCRSHFLGQLIANISACAIQDCASLLENASAVRADAAILLPPYYYSNATFDGLLEFFHSVIGKSSIPVYLYNFPRHTNVEITPKLFTALCENNSRIQGIKDSSGNLDGSAALKSARPGLQVFVGSDTLALSTLEKGLDGSVTGGGSVVPECLMGMQVAFAGGQKSKASAWQKALDSWTSYRKDLVIVEIAAAKAGLAARIPGFPVYVRPPLSSASQKIVDSVAEHLSRVVMPAIANASALK
ncbi:MAG: dihydrodipicolinate synthase family protein [Chloroflexi bacterium]|nr:dihydrodipicolinate synthase family protein [Chloroflexota bacterium]